LKEGAKMIYYKVPRALDQKPLYKKSYKPYRELNGWFLIANELLTETECRKRNAPIKLLERVEIKRNKVYFCFGARYSYKEEE
jgi:hypothetical protein